MHTWKSLALKYTWQGQCPTLAFVVAHKDNLNSH